MKNITSTYQVAGTSALKPSFEQSNVIVLSSTAAHRGKHVRTSDHVASEAASLRQLAAEEWADTVSSIRHGSVMGTPFGRFTRIQALAFGGTLIAITFAGLFL